MHAAARLVCDLSPRDHVTLALKSLRWLPEKQQIEFISTCLFIWLLLDGHLSTSRTSSKQHWCLAELSKAPPAMTLLFSKPDWIPANVLSLSPHRAFGISYRLNSRLKQTLCNSNGNWKLICSQPLIFITIFCCTLLLNRTFHARLCNMPPKTLTVYESWYD